MDILALFPYYGVEECSTITNGSLPLEKYQRALELIDNLIFSWHFEFLRVDHMKHVLSNLNRKQVKVHLMKEIISHWALQIEQLLKRFGNI